jgi:hypothetical protein
VVVDDQHYLFRLRAACLAQPDLNFHQLAAIGHLLAVAQRVETTEAWLVATDQFAVLNEAMRRDRWANQWAAAMACDHPWLAAAAAARYRGEVGDALEACGHDVMAAIQRLFLGLLMLHTGMRGGDAFLGELRQAFGVLLATDPAFRPGEWPNVPRYAQRMPWATARVEQWLEPWWPKQWPEVALPQAEIATECEQWLAGLETWDGPFPSVAPLPLMPVDFTVFERQSIWPDDLLEAHRQGTRHLLEGAASDLARESIAVARTLEFDALATRNVLWVESLVAPLWVALLAPDWHTRAMETMTALTGVSPVALTDHPRVHDLLTRNVVPWLDRDLTGLRAGQGEAGFQLLMAMRAVRDNVIEGRHVSHYVDKDH